MLLLEEWTYQVMFSMVILALITHGLYINSLWPSDTIWQHIWVKIGSGNNLLSANVMESVLKKNTRLS